MTDNLVLPLSVLAFNNKISFSFIGFIIFCLIFLFSVYKIFKDDLDSYTRFDLGFKTLFGILIVSRVLAVINNLGLYESDWSSVFNLLDGKFLYSGLVLGIIVIVVFFNAKINKKLGYLYTLDRLLISYIFSIIFLILGMALDGRIMGIVNYGGFGLNYADGLTRFPVAFIQIAYNIFCLIPFMLLARLKEKRGLVSGIYLIVFSAIEFILRYFSANYEPAFFNLFDLYQIISLIIIVICIFFIISLNKTTKKESLNSNAKSDGTIQRAQFDIDEYKRRKLTAKEMFSMSYSSIGRDNKELLPTKERVSSWYKAMKRANPSK